MRTVSIREAKQNLTRYLRNMNGADILITRHGKPVAGIIGFANEDEALEFRLAHDPKFVALVNRSFRSGLMTQEDVRRQISRRETVERRARRRTTAEEKSNSA